MDVKKKRERNAIGRVLYRNPLEEEKRKLAAFLYTQHNNTIAILAYTFGNVNILSRSLLSRLAGRMSHEAKYLADVFRITFIQKSRLLRRTLASARNTDMILAKHEPKHRTQHTMRKHHFGRAVTETRQHTHARIRILLKYTNARSGLSCIFACARTHNKHNRVVQQEPTLRQAWPRTLGRKGRNVRSTCRCSHNLRITRRRAVSCGLHRPTSQVIHRSGFSSLSLRHHRDEEGKK